MNNNYTLQTVERALSFLEYVATAPVPPNIRDVSKALDLNITTSYHLLRTLMARDFIKRDDQGRLELGDGVAILAQNYRRHESVEQLLAPVVQQLTASTMETSFLSLREGHNVVLKVLVEGSQRLRVAGLYVGLSGHEYRRAAGKAVLAHLESAERKAMLDESLANTAGQLRKAIMKVLEKELPLIASRGWSADDGQTEEGIISIGSPVFDAAGAVLGAVGIVTPIFRMDKSPDAFREAVLAAAAEATRLLKNTAFRAH
jgi:IclR family transcriptional regulator, acetate operon repressor